MKPRWMLMGWGSCLLACGGQAENPTRRQGVPHGFVAVDAGPEVTAPLPPTMALPAEAPPKFEDPGCPEPVEPVEDVTCDPFANGECGPGWACYPFVNYPTSPCEVEGFGTRCEVEGPGVQGDDCSASTCAAGFLCVATGQGTVCANLCEPGGARSCPAGLLCGSVDIRGYGVCF